MASSIDYQAVANRLAPYKVYDDVYTTVTGAGETAGAVITAPARAVAGTVEAAEQLASDLRQGVADAGQDIKDALDDSMEKAGQAAKDAGTGLALPLAALAAGLLWVVSR